MNVIDAAKMFRNKKIHLLLMKGYHTTCGYNVPLDNLLALETLETSTPVKRKPSKPDWRDRDENGRIGRLQWILMKNHIGE